MSIETAQTIWQKLREENAEGSLFYYYGQNGHHVCLSSPQSVPLAYTATNYGLECRTNYKEPAKEAGSIKESYMAVFASIWTY